MGQSPRESETCEQEGMSCQFWQVAEPIPPGRRCMRCGSSKTGINEDGRDHWHKKPGGHICSSCYYKEWRKKHTKPHRVYEKHHKVCILPWGQIHFINGDKKDIRIMNMMLLRRGGSALLLKPRIPKDRRCVTCGSPEGHVDWSKTENGYVCSLCVTEARRADLKSERL